MHADEIEDFEYQKTRRLGQTRCEIENNLFTMKFNKHKNTAVIYRL